VSELESHSDLEHLLGSDLLLGHWRRVKLLENLLHVLLRNLIRFRTFNDFKIFKRCILCIFVLNFKLRNYLTMELCLKRFIKLVDL